MNVSPSDWKKDDAQQDHNRARQHRNHDREIELFVGHHQSSTFAASLFRSAPRSISCTLPIPARSNACAAAAPMAMQGPITRTLDNAVASPSIQRPAATRLSTAGGVK